MINQLNHPRLHIEGYTKTSECCFKYNCIAHAADDKEKWWWPFGTDLLGREAYWPKKAPRRVIIRAFVLAFKSLGYVPCKNGDLEDGYEKVAIYVLDNVPTHMARQLGNGEWSHKMGGEIDLLTSLTAVEGPTYGKAQRYLKRTRTKPRLAIMTKAQAPIELSVPAGPKPLAKKHPPGGAPGGCF